MKYKQHDTIVGLGVYTLQEAALYSRISPYKLSRWLFGTCSAQPIIRSQLFHERQISFLDLIQAIAIDKAREIGLSVQKIRQAIDFVREDMNIEFPLAHRYALVEFNKELHIKDGVTTEVTQVTGRDRNQQLMPCIVKDFLRDLEFNDLDVACKYSPFVKNGIKITFDPKVQFGQPLVGDTGCRADILNKAYKAENSYKSVADEFGIEDEDVKVAVSYMESIAA